MPRVSPRTVKRNRVKKAVQKKVQKKARKEAPKSMKQQWLDSPLQGWGGKKLPTVQRAAPKKSTTKGPIRIDQEKMQQRKKANKKKVYKT